MADTIRNRVKYSTVSILNSIALLISSGAVVQTFLIWIGVPNNRVEIYSSITLITQVFAMFVCTVIADKFKNLKKTVAICLFIFPTVFISMILILTGAINGVSSMYCIVLFGSIVCNLFLGIYNVLIYKLPYSIFDINDFGRISSIIGILSGAIGIGASFLLSLCVSCFDYRIVMIVTFSLGSILWIICGALTSSYKVIEGENMENSSGNLKDFFRYPLFYKSVIPTVLRGIGTGIIGLIAAIGLRDNILNTKSATYITVFTSLSSMAGYFIYMVMDRHVKHKYIIILFGVLSGIFIPFTTIGGNLAVTYIFFFLSNLTLTVIGIAHPVLVFESVPYKNIGRYTAWRMLFFTFGQAIPGFFIEGLYGAVGSLGIMLIGAACSLISSVWLGFVLKKGKDGAE